VHQQVHQQQQEQQQSSQTAQKAETRAQSTKSGACGELVLLQRAQPVRDRSKSSSAAKRRLAFSAWKMGAESTAIFVDWRLQRAEKEAPVVGIALGHRA